MDFCMMRLMVGFMPFVEGFLPKGEIKTGDEKCCCKREPWKVLYFT